MRRGTQILALALVLGMLLGLLPGASAREVGDAPRGGGGGWLQWNCEFQSLTNLLGWRIIDANGDGCTFGPYLNEDDTFCLRSDRNQAEPETEPQASDDYLISPRIQLPAGQEYTLGLELGGILNGGYNVDCEIYVYTGAETLRPENLYSLLDRPYRNHYVFWSRWETFTMDLSAYAGQTVQLVLRHRNPDRSVLMVKRVFVSGQEPWTELSKVTAFHVPEPRLGVTPEALTEGDITFPDYAAYELVPGSLRYFKIVSEQTVEMHNEEFTAEGEYNLSFRVRPKAGASFTAEGIASVNGRFAQYVYREDRGEAEVYLFNIPSLAPDRELKEVNLLTEPPVVGASPAGTPERWLENGAWNFNYSLASAVWSPGVTGTFAPRVAYSLEAVIRPENGFYVTDHTHFTLNGAPFSFHSDLPEQEGAHYLRADFPADQGALLRRAELILTQPQGGQLPEDARIVDRRYRLVSQSWFPLSQWGEVQEPLGEEETLEDGRTYRCVFLLRPEAGQAFNEGTRVFVNGEEATLYGRNQDGDWVYCLDVKAQQPSPIYMIDLDVPIPRAGEEFYAGADSAGARVRESNPRVYITADNWYNEGGISGTPLPFEAGKTYIVEVELRERLGWVITEDTLIRINGEAVPWKQKLNVSTWGVASRGYTMEAPVPVEEADFRVTAPWAGTNYNWEADSTGVWCVDVPGRIIFDKWYTQDGAGGGHMTFEEGQGYVLELLFQPDAPYQFAQDAVIRINGEPAAQVTREDAHTWRIRSRPFIAGAPQEIQNLDLTLHHVPAAGETFDPDQGQVVEASTMAPVIWGRSLWQAAEGETVYPLTFREGGSYAASMVIQGQPGWVLTDRTQVRIDGQAPASVTKLGEGLWLVTSRTYTAGLQRTVPAVEVYANVPIFDIPLSEPYIPGYEPYAVYDWYWSDAAGQPLPQDAAVVGGAEYSLTVLVKPEEGYMFSRDTQVARLFWEPCEIVSLEPHLLTLRGLCTARMGTPNPFVDVEKGKFYYEPVIWAYYQEPQITAGTDETHFSPNKVCTRAQVVTFLWRAAGCPAPTLRDHPFTDVKEGAYYYEAMLWAVENGITNGATATTFAPNKACTRGQVVTFLWRAAGSPEPAGTEHPFTDVKEGAYYYKAMLWAIQEGVTNGATDTAFAPNKDCTRAQVVTFLYRAYGPKG